MSVEGLCPWKGGPGSPAPLDIVCRTFSGPFHSQRAGGWWGPTEHSAQAGVSSPGTPSLPGAAAPVSELADFSHPYSALHRDQTQWPGSFPGMTTCGLLPLLQHLPRHCQQPLLCHGDAKDCGLWHRQAGEVRGKKRGVGRHQQEGWGWREGFGRVFQLGWPHLCCLQLRMDLSGWGVQAGLQPLPQPEHHIHILVTGFGHLCFSWQCQSSRTAGKREKWTSLAMSLLLQLSQRSLLVVLSHVCAEQS